MACGLHEGSTQELSPGRSLAPGKIERGPDLVDRAVEVPRGIEQVRQLAPKERVGRIRGDSLALIEIHRTFVLSGRGEEEEERPEVLTGREKRLEIVLSAVKIPFEPEAIEGQEDTGRHAEVERSIPIQGKGPEPGRAGLGHRGLRIEQPGGCGRRGDQQKPDVWLRIHRVDGNGSSESSHARGVVRGVPSALP